MPPLDLYLNKRLADFESRLQKQVLQSGAGPGAERTFTSHLITEAYNKVYKRLRRGGELEARGLDKAHKALQSLKQPPQQ